MVHPGGPPPGGQWDTPGAAAAATPPHRNRTRLIIAAIVAVLLVAGGVVTYVAVSSSSNNGAGSPQKAVSATIDDLNNSDLLGLLDHLPPGERSALTEPLKEQISQEKRLHVIKPDANFSKVSGVNLSLQNLTFDPNVEVINDRVSVVKITGGTFSYNADLLKLPLTKEYLDASFPHGLGTSTTASGTVDIGAKVRQSGKPIRIATQKVNGGWYASILYTIADAVTQSNGEKPGPADYIPAQGASSPTDLVRQFIDAASRSDTRTMISLLSPDELAVMHDYGGLLVKQTSGNQSPSFTVSNLDLATTNISGGQRVLLKSITAQTNNGPATVSIDGDCYNVQANGDSKRFCPGDLVDSLAQGPLKNKELTSDERAAFQRLFQSLPKLGIDTTTSGGKWYLNPLRSYADFATPVLAGLQDNDLLTIISAITRQ
jgi:hypothetical protein